MQAITNLPYNTPSGQPHTNNRIVNRIFWAVAIAVSLIALGSFSLSFIALYELATGNGIPALLGWIWLLIVDLSMVIYTAAILVAQLQRRGARLPIGLTIFYAVVTVTGNILHAPPTPLGWFVASLPPLSLILGTEMLRAMGHHIILHKGRVSTLAELALEIDTRRAELDKLQAAIDMTNAKNSSDSPAFVKGDLAALDKANEAKTDKIAERRQQVLAMLQEGMEKADIAEALEVSVRTISRDISTLNGQVRGA